jgi:hypothetical protein
MSADSPAVPKHYFLNERHQLAPTEKEGGKSPAKVLHGDFKTHGRTLANSIEVIRAARRTSTDPTAKSRVFILARPESSLKKESKGKKAVDGAIESQIKLSGKDAQIIQRLGFDLLSVMPEGSAVVHTTDERLGQMQQSLGLLEDLNVREKNKWAHIKEFADVPIDYKTSLGWWEERPQTSAWESVIDLQPFLTRKEVDQLIGWLKQVLKKGERLSRIGTEFSGRTWIQALLFPLSIEHLAGSLQAIASIHPPLLAVTCAPVEADDDNKQANPTARRLANSFSPKQLPCVAVLDTGIPAEHVLLGDFRRGGTSGEGASSETQDGHGSFVASQVIFGDVECDDQGEPLLDEAKCSVYDANVSNGPGSILPDAIDSAIDRVSNAAPDVRVFNMSVDSKQPLDFYQGSMRETWLRRIADLDNRIFANDLIVVVAAGNSGRGDVPQPAYPNHYEDERWRLRAWSRAFNAMTCGGTSERFALDAVANEPGAPSPFSRLGPGFAKSFKPDFCAHAGNSREDYEQVPGDGLGVWGCDEMGGWSDRSATSFAAPLLAREAARTLQYLKTKCQPDARPFGVLVKAVMALRAERSPLSAPLRKLADYASGYGSVRLEDIEAAVDERATFIWQGIIGSEDEILTVELPLPGVWVRDAELPVLRLVVAWDTPVNPAVEDIWACRQVSLTLRPKGSHGSIPSPSRNSVGYPLAERRYELSGAIKDQLEWTDSCLAELKYTTLGMAPYPAGRLEFSPQQRVAIAYELMDKGAAPVSPHAAIQALPVAATLNNLGAILPAGHQAVTVHTSPI